MFEQIKNIDQLVEAFLKLENKTECKKFLRDLCTMKELQSISERLAVMFMVNEGVPYREICKKTGVSTATITRVAQWLKHGEGGYRLILKKMGKEKKPQKYRTVLEETRPLFFRGPGLYFSFCDGY